MSQNQMNGQTVEFQAGPSVDATPTPSVSTADIAAIVAMNSNTPAGVAAVEQAARAVSGTSAAAVPTPAVASDAYTVTVRAPEGKGMLAYLVGPGAQVVLQGIDADNALFAVEAGNLRISTKEGAEVLLLDFVTAAQSPAGITVVSGGDAVSGKALLASLQEELVAEKIADIEPAAGDVISSVSNNAPVSSRDGFLAPNEVGGGFVSNEGIFSSVIDPFALPIWRDAIKIEEGEFELLQLSPFTPPPFNNVIANDDVITVAEDSGATNVTAILLANDSDPQGNPFSIVRIVTPPTNGTLTLVNGVVTYTPNANYNGPDSFVYEVRDSLGATDTARAVINVTPVNDNPTPENDPEDPDHPGHPGNPGNPGDDRYITGEDIPHRVALSTLLANDTDIDGDTLTVISVQNPVNGTVRIENGFAIFTPNANYNGPAQYQYTVSDGNGGTGTATVFITVTPNSVDARDDTYTLPNRNAFTMNVLANDVDPEGNTITITSFTQPAIGSVTMVNGQLVYSADASQRGGYTTTFTYSVRDNFGTSQGVPGADDTDTATVTIVVPAAANDVDARDDTYTLANRNPLTMNVLANDVDPQGDSFSITSFTQPAVGSVALVNGQFVYTPAAGNRDAYTTTFTYTITDALGATDTATVTVNVGAASNSVIANDDVITVAEDSGATNVTATLRANDSDPEGDSFTITRIVTQPAHGTLTLVNGQVVYTPNANYNGPDEFVYEITDSRGATDTARAVINVTPVNDVPDPENDPESNPENTGNERYTTGEDIPHRVSLAELLANDVDADGDTLTVISVQNAQNGTVRIENGFAIFTPNAEYSGPAQYTYTVSDGNGGTATATVFITVTPNSVDAVNDTYTLANRNPLTMNVLANDVDPQGNAISITTFTQPSIGSVALVNGQFVYTPAAGTRGGYTTTFTYSVRDNFGTSQGVPGADDTDTATVTIVVPAAANDVDARDDVYTLPNRTAAFTMNVLANDVDPQGDAFSIVNFTQPAQGSVALVNGQFVYTPVAGRGAYSTTFTYTIRDALGAEDTATVTVNVPAAPNSVNADNDVYTLPNRTAAFTMNVLANDEDPQGDAFSIVNFTQPAQGSVSLVNGQFVYTPVAGRGAYSTTFTYTIRDALGAEDTATVTVNVPAAPNSVDARNDAYTLANRNAFTMNVLSNDVDPQGDSFSIRTFTQPAVGSVSLVNGQFVYTPAAGTRGAYSTTFTYTIRDALGAEDTATVTVNVPAAANSVDARDDVYNLNNRNTLSNFNVLVNDVDPQGDSFSLISYTQPHHGTLTWNGSSFSYTPGSFRGAYSTSFTYTIRDALGATDTATVTINVPAAPNSVDARNDAYSLAWNQTQAALNVLANDIDPQGDSFGVLSFTQPAVGTVSWNGSQFVYNSGGNQGYTTTFTYTVRDQYGATDTATVTITVGTNPGGGGGGGGGGDGDICPLVIDLDGDGISMIGRGVEFDLDGDGTLDTVSNWFGARDGILAVDRNGDGQVSGIDEVFGGHEQSGFEDLAATEDSNGDGIINNQDAGWANLRIWLDVNGDGVGQDEELFTLDTFGITAIHTGVNGEFYSELGGGSYLSESSIVETEEGTLNSFDVWFRDYQLANGDLAEALGAPAGDDVSQPADYNAAPAADAATATASSDVPVAPYNPDQHQHA